MKWLKMSFPRNMRVSDWAAEFGPPPGPWRVSASMKGRMWKTLNGKQPCPNGLQDSYVWESANARLPTQASRGQERYFARFLSMQMTPSNGSVQ